MLSHLHHLSFWKWAHSYNSRVRWQKYFRSVCKQEGFHFHEHSWFSHYQPPPSSQDTIPSKHPSASRLCQAGPWQGTTPARPSAGSEAKKYFCQYQTQIEASVLTKDSLAGCCNCWGLGDLSHSQLMHQLNRPQMSKWTLREELEPFLQLLHIPFSELLILPLCQRTHSLQQK